MKSHARSICRAATLIIVIAIIIGLAPIFSVNSQGDGDDECNAITEDALQRVGSACAELGNNEACYGHFAINSELVEEADSRFESEGDFADILDLKAIQTYPLNISSGDWGVALMTVQIDTSAESDTTLLFVLFGDTEVQDVRDDDSLPMHAVTLNVNATDNCQQMTDGLLVHSPEGKRARVMVNGVELRLSSTAFIQAHQDGDMHIWVLDGQVDVTADGAMVSVDADHHTVIPLHSFIPSDRPSEPDRFSRQDDHFRLLWRIIQMIRNYLGHYFGDQTPSNLITLDTVDTDGNVLVELNIGYHCTDHQVPEGLPIQLFFSRGFATEAELYAAQANSDAYLYINGEAATGLEISTYIDHSLELEDEVCCHLDHRYQWGTPPAGTYQFEVGSVGVSYECELVIAGE